MRTLLITLFSMHVLMCTANAAQPSPIWLEKKEIRYGEQVSHSKGDSETHQKENKQKPEKKKKRRSPMSRPVSYYLKTGIFPDLTEDSPALLKSVCWLKMPDQSFKRLMPERTQEGVFVYDEALQAGFYQIHLYQDAGVVDDSRFLNFSTLWFRNSGEDEFEIQPHKETKREGLHGEEPVFYLKELTKDAENNYVSQKRYTGDNLPVQVLFKGTPVAGASVTLTTSKGWQKSVLTDENGKASFLLVKEIFHNDKIYKEAKPYLVKAIYEVKKNGVYNSQAYSKQVFTATSRLMIYPTPYDWKSKSAGFYVFSGSTLTVILAAAIRRKRSLAI